MSLQLWAVDSLVKVFSDDIPPDAPHTTVVIEAARNETEAGQLVLRCDSDHLMSVEVTFGALEAASGGLPLAGARARLVGYVPIRANTTGTPDEHLVRKAPCPFPDPLLPQRHVRVRQGECLPIWIEIAVPADTPPDEYEGPIHIATDQGQAEATLRVKVYPAAVPDRRTLKVTNWVSWENIARYHSTPIWSEAYWKLLATYARNLAAHRQNVVITPIFDLIEFSDDNGRLAFDFARFDRFVDLFQREGVIGYIEGGHLGGRGPGGWEAPDFVITTFRPEGGRLVREAATAGSPEANAFLAQFLPALQGHLEARGWLDIYFQHLADEPIAINLDSYNKLSAALKRYAPRIRTVEANMCHEVTDLDIWVPQLGDWHESHEFYRSRVAAGDELWFYTCLAPTGTYANRFIDYHLVKTRLLHWLNFLYEATGFLHWGYNYWCGEPFAVDVEPVHSHRMCLPPGDNCIVYPGEGGPVDSLRFEAMRDGIEDYELLRKLAEVDPDRARAIARMVIRDYDDYDLSPATFRQARRALLEATPG
jgi:hypothetical protein